MAKIETGPPALLVSDVAAQRDTAVATCEATLDRLSEVVRYVRRTGGYMKPDDQQVLLRAEAALVAAGRKVER